MKPFIFSFLTLTLMFFSSCGSNSKETIQVVDVNQFPVSIKLNETDAITLPIKSFGISEIKVVDSLLIVSVLGNENFWHVYSLPQMDSIGSYFNVGNAPYEMTMPIPCYQSSFYKNGNDIIASIPLPERQKMVKFNMTKLISDNDYEGNATFWDINSENMTAWTYCLDDEQYIQAYIDPIDKRIVRTIRNYSNNEIVNNNKYIEKLNSKSIEKIEDIQLLLTNPAIRPDGRMVAEIPGYSNQIVIYEIFDKNGVCIEYKDLQKEAQDVDKLINNFTSLFGGGYGYNDYFALIRNKIDKGNVIDQSIDFFSWDGNPIGSIDLGMNTIRRFDISERNGILFCLNAESDCIITYNISSFLDSINKYV